MRGEGSSRELRWGHSGRSGFKGFPETVEREVVRSWENIWRI